MSGLHQPDQIPSLTRSTAVFVAYNVVYGVLHTGTDLADHIGGLAAGSICGLCISIPLVQNPPRRGIHNVAIAAAAVALFIGAAVALPRPGQLRSEQLADLLDKEIIPVWVNEQKKLAALKDLPEPQRRTVSLLLQYTEDRREAWSLLVEGFRKHDINKVNQANGKQREAQQVVKQIASLNN
jgi:hypothetical protein